MKFTELSLRGVYHIEPEPFADERGFFARTYCRKEFGERGLCTAFAQCSVSFNLKEGTLRGMHWQAEPKPEIKLVRCTAGAIYDVLVDIRPDSSTYCKWVAMELTSENRSALYVPAGIAHGFQTLTPNAEVFYQISEDYLPDLARGARWDDPAFNITWPEPSPIGRTISLRDQQHPDYVF